jgi:hypothetical protein
MMQRILEEKTRDCELAAELGQNLLKENKKLSGLSSLLLSHHAEELSEVAAKTRELELMVQYYQTSGVE